MKTTPDTRPLAERLPAAGKVVMTATQSALKRQIEREAMETARETGRTPRQLADERGELIAALRDILDAPGEGRVAMSEPDSFETQCRKASELLARLD